MIAETLIGIGLAGYGYIVYKVIFPDKPKFKNFDKSIEVNPKSYEPYSNRYRTVHRKGNTIVPTKDTDNTLNDILIGAAIGSMMSGPSKSYSDNVSQKESYVEPSYNSDYGSSAGGGSTSSWDSSDSSSSSSSDSGGGGD